MGPLKKPDCALALAAGGRPLKTVCEVLGVARSGVAVKRVRPSDWQDGRSARVTDDTELSLGYSASLAVMMPLNRSSLRGTTGRGP